MAREEVFRPLIENSLRKYLIESVYNNTKIDFAKLKNTAGMKGAYYNFKENFNKQLYFVILLEIKDNNIIYINYGAYITRMIYLKYYIIYKIIVYI